ncbi:MAG: penicillin-binding protein 2 [Nocardioidaceae bacterium]
MSATTSNATKARLRLIVVRVLMISLFITLLSRLWFLQVASGQDYRAAAQAQAKRELIIQPARGLIVDDMGRPLVANRTSWVIALDRNLFDKLTAQAQDQVLGRLASVLGRAKTELEQRSQLCSEPTAKAERCWNGSSIQPIPLASDVPQHVAVQILEQTEDYPAILAQQDSVRAYPQPYGVNAAQLLGYLSSITKGEFDQAKVKQDRSLNGASVVGRAGMEKTYDRYLRGMPGQQTLTVDARGRVIDEGERVEAQPGETLVTSIDAKLQSFVERQLHEALTTARGTFDKVTGKNYVADTGAAVVMQARTGRIVAMASQPTYDPNVWVGGISKRALRGLYAKSAGTPLLSRATQGQLAPGSTWKPIMTVGALNNGFEPDTKLDCSSGLQVGNRWFKNYESAAYGPIGFARALELSCDTFFYRVGLHFWEKYGSDPTDVDAKDPLIDVAKDFGFGRSTGIDLPGESRGRIADRHWKQEYWKTLKGRYCKVAAEKGAPNDYLHVFAREFCLEGNHYRAGDAVNYVIGQGDTLVTPLQLARAYSALANGGTLYRPTIGKAIVATDGALVKKISPVVEHKIDSTRAALREVDQALTGTPRQGTLAWRFVGFPLDQVPVRGKTGSAEVWGKQSTSWVATYTKDYVVVMMVTQGGTGSGTSGPYVRKIWERLYGVTGDEVKRARAIIPGVVAPARLPTFTQDGSILPPVDPRGAS